MTTYYVERTEHYAGRVVKQEALPGRFTDHTKANRRCVVLAGMCPYRGLSQHHAGQSVAFNRRDLKDYVEFTRMPVREGAT